jgi:Icc-related predicted phosphoesterase
VKKIALGSDIHLEFGELDIVNQEGADVLILSGDICVASKINQSLYFFEKASSEFKHVIYVLGNHEHYGSNFYDTFINLKDALKHLKNIFVLNNTYVILDEFTYYGGTLWTDYGKRDPLMMLNAPKFMIDYDEIENFTVTGALLNHEAFISGLTHMLETHPTDIPMGMTNDKFVVISHHAPSYESINEKYFASPTNPLFTSDLSEVILDNPRIKLWTHGHMHDSCDYQIGETRIVCNPRGYFGYEPQANKYQLKCLEV